MTIRELEVIGVVVAAAALWSQILSLIRWPLRLIVVRREFDFDAARAVISYLHAVNPSRRSGGGFFRGDRLHVRPLGRVVMVFAEVLYKGRCLVWHRRRPIWYGVRANANMADVYSLSYLRGSIDWDALLNDASEWDDDQMVAKGGHRYRVVVHGALPFRGEKSADQPETVPQDAPGGDFTLPGGGHRILRWAREDIGVGQQIGLDAMSLRPEILALAGDIDRFMRSREWCEERSIPWRRGWSLSGPPGTGKTSFVRAIAVEHDLPVNVFDLGGLDNYGLRTAWTAMLRDTPCVALIEDVDGVYGKHLANGSFDPRELKAKGPSFDCLLNCIAGVSAADGVLLFVTTNRPEALDPALRRGGRLDMEAEFVGLDHAGRVKMATRILGDGVEADRVAVDPEMSKLSPADLQERLCRIAMARRFGDAA